MFLQVAQSIVPLKIAGVLLHPQRKLRLERSLWETVGVVGTCVFHLITADPDLPDTELEKLSVTLHYYQCLFLLLTRLFFRPCLGDMLNSDLYLLLY